MSEVLRETAEFDPATAVAGTLHDWLQAEVESSTAGRNAVLDDWQKFQQDLRLPFESHSNQSGEKARSHFTRLQHWTLMTEQFPDLIEDEYFMARQLFCAQMFISGAHRRQCFIQSEKSEDYTQRRHQAPVGINLRQTVTGRLSEYGPNGRIPGNAYQNSAWASIRESTLRANEESLDIAEIIQTRGRQDTGKEESASVALLKVAQRIWTSLAVDYITLAAQRANGSLRDVPFLEAKSISDNPQLYYPFRSEN